MCNVDWDLKGIVWKVRQARLLKEINIIDLENDLSIIWMKLVSVQS